MTRVEHIPAANTLVVAHQHLQLNLVPVLLIVAGVALLSLALRRKSA